MAKLIYFHHGISTQKKKKKKKKKIKEKKIKQKHEVREAHAYMGS